MQNDGRAGRGEQVGSARSLLVLGALLIVGVSSWWLLRDPGPLLPVDSVDAKSDLSVQAPLPVEARVPPGRSDPDPEQPAGEAGAASKDQRALVAADAAARRQFLVHVAPSEPKPAGVMVELLFGDRDALRDQPLVALRDNEYDAVWPMGDDAVLPWAVDFAFPTAGRSLQHVAPEQYEVELRMPDVAGMLILLVESDGTTYRGPVEAEMRVLGAPWPSGRWRPLTFSNFEASIVAEIGLTIEVRGRTVSGRVFQAALATGDVAGKWVERRIELPVGGSIDVELVDLPSRTETEDRRWQVQVFGVDGHTRYRPLRIEREGLHFKLRGPTHFPAEQPTLLVLAWEPDPMKPVQYWGKIVGSERVVHMQRSEVVAEGRVDADGFGVGGPTVALMFASGSVVLNSALPNEKGRFWILGPDPRELPLVVRLRAADAVDRDSVRLPRAGEIVLRAR